MKKAWIAFHIVPLVVDVDLMKFIRSQLIQNRNFFAPDTF